jgi:hypothetical protein
MKRAQLLLLVSCASSSNQSATLAEMPRWAKDGADLERFPSDRFISAVASAQGLNALETAKLRAQAEVGKQVSSRIRQESSDASVEKNGAYAYEIAAMTYASTDVRVSNLRFETFAAGDQAYVLAAVEKASVAKEQAARREAAIEELRRCIGGAAAELRANLLCRSIVPRAFEHDAVIRAFGGPPAASDLIDLAGKLEEKIASLAGDGPQSVEQAADLLSAHLVVQAKEPAKITVAPLTYGTTPFSSQFGRALALELERALAEQSVAEGGKSKQWVVRGTYTERGAAMRILLTMRDAISGELIGGAGTLLELARIPDELATKPQNFDEALEDQRLLAAGEAVSGNLRVEVWTNRGAQNLVFREGEPLKIFLRVNRPAYVRLVYLLANRAKVPIEQSYFIDASKVNLAVEYPATFRVSPPFGVEQLFAVAFSEKPEPLPTIKQTIGGESYDVVPDAQTLVKHRGLQRVQSGPETAESTVSLTTTP